MSDFVKSCLVGGMVAEAYAARFLHMERVTDRDHWRFYGSTQLTISLCDAVVKAGGADPQFIARTWAQWYGRGELSAPEAAILKSLVMLHNGSPWNSAGQDDEPGNTNGAALRAAPLSFLLDPALEPEAQCLRQITHITHLGEEAWFGVMAMVHALRTIRAGTVHFPQQVIRQLPDCQIRARLESMLKSNEKNLRRLAEKTGAGRSAAESVPLAIYAAWRATEDGFGPVIRALAAAGSAPDTLSSLAGQLAGAALGISAIPDEWLARTRAANDFDEYYAIVQQFSDFIHRKGGVQTLF